MSIKILTDTGTSRLISTIKTLLSDKAEADHTHAGMVTSAAISTTYDETTQALSVNLNVS